ncbi:MAG: acetylglutamate kinase [Flavobacteriales bacterium]|nr:acetylglutamate kinase [Flavobacteriales bacterium]
MIKVIKIGGNVIDDSAALESFEKDFARMEGSKILIHGGGKIATQMSKKLGIETLMVEGRRVTDRSTLDVVTMVYGGLISKNVVATLQSLGCNAIGLSGADANAILSHKRSGSKVDYGYVGDVDTVNAGNIKKLTDAGFTPVFCAITHDGKGTLLNTNADTVASSVACGMANLEDVELIFCFEKNGVLSSADDHTSVISNINAEKYSLLKESGVVSGGMLPKLENAFAALRAGVKKVIITSPAYITDSKCPHTEIVL